MTEINIRQSPQPVVVERQPVVIERQPVVIEKRGASAVVWGLLVLVLLGVIAWFIFGGPLHRTRTTIHLNTPTGAVARPMPTGLAS